jgi:glutamate synthase domain-containing protein 2/glutamate synthase domain-containing protein 1/glutamate synthase domain-containing protein 3
MDKKERRATTKPGIPPKQGLYDPANEHDACGIGFIVDIKGRRSHSIVHQALEILVNLEHRGACGCEPNTGDGAGILMQVPHGFFREACTELGFQLPAPGQYGVGMVYLPPDPEDRRECEEHFESIVREEGQQILGWRDVPTDNQLLGETALSCEPFIRQIFIGRNPEIEDDQAFERKLYVIRRRGYYDIAASDIGGSEYFYLTSLSQRTIVYKGMLISAQVEPYFPDLVDPRVETALALVHSRFSTNTFPSWERAHPYRYLIHNGEINTLRGNVNWMHTRQAMLASELFGDDLPKLFPVIAEGGSDSGKFDNCLEFLSLGGRSLPHAAMMMIPEPWENHATMSDEKKAFYEYHSCLMEPWDGPASVAFSDGVVVGAMLDRNGFRPSRYYVTKDDRVILSSETGVVDIRPEMVEYKGRLQPGRMLLIDTAAGRIISDEEIKHQVAIEHPYRQWLDEHLIDLHDLPAAQGIPRVEEHETVLVHQQAFGYTYEDMRVFLKPMVEQLRDPVGSMGNDAPLAVLSDRAHLLYNYFKQHFAQVTNPPVDPLREEVITSAETTIGPERNLLKPEPESCRQIKLDNPILTNDDLARLREIDRPGFSSVTLPILFSKADGEAGLEKGMDELFAAADQAIDEGANLLILSDRGFDGDRVPIPALLAVAGLHHHLVREGARTKVGLALESGEPREVHHFCLLIGYGVQAINPYMVFESLADMIREGMMDEYGYEEAAKRYVKGAVKGVVKVMAKMGISTIKSYRGAQIFEAVGLSQEVIDRYFTWTTTQVQGIGIEEIAREALARHRRAFPEFQVDERTLEEGGQYQWRKDGEHHLFNPHTVHKLQQATRTNNYETYKDYARHIDDQSEKLGTLRGLLELKFADEPIRLEEVESVESITRRFKSGAMSYGSISKEAHETLAIAMNRLGGRSNTGEGGEDPARYTLEPNGDSKNSAIKQVASGRFGVTSQYLVNARELQIKMAQGAKPGEGGELPGRKVYPWIATVRHSTPGVELISPPPHHDIYSIEDLAQLIHDLKNANQDARINVKLVSEFGVGTIAAGVAKGHADVVLISGYDGGTGASPQTSIKHAGLPWELGLAETHQTLLLNNLRSRIVVEADGQLKTGRDVVIAALLGAEEYGFATTALVTLGCLMMRVCHLDTCPVGVATQNPELRKRFTGKPEHVVNFLRFIAEDMREIMAKLGFRTIDEMVGRTDRLESKKAVEHWKAAGLDLTSILYQPEVGPEVGRYCTEAQDHGLQDALDNTTLMELCKPALERGEKVRADLPIRNVNRVTGTIVGSEVTRRFGADGLPEDSIHLKFHGAAGQSFAAFVPNGMTMEVEGDANDYFGKGLSGGKLILYPPAGSTFVPRDNIICGNVAFYGATTGQAYIRGMAGERFCVRNSGMNAVVEAVGDHACEYMTGGRVVILGPTGRNFAAGMSGGIAYVLDDEGDFRTHYNQGTVELERLEDEEEIREVRAMIERHIHYTGSSLGSELLEHWEETLAKFIKVMPRDYKRMLEAFTSVEEQGLTGDEAALAAFREGVAVA